MIQPQVLRPRTGSPGLGLVCDGCRRLSGEGVSVHPGLYLCMTCVKQVLEAVLQDSGTQEELAEAIRQAAEEAAATVVREAIAEAARQAGQAVAARVLEAVGESLEV